MIESINRSLCRLHHQNHCHLVGNATSGLVLALGALGVKGKKVAIPNGVCPNVPVAVLLSGNAPVYIDISANDLGLSIADLRSRGADVAAVIAVHAYGSVGNIAGLVDYCRATGIPLIEDLAVAQGAKSNGRAVGSFGDVAVVSFGSGKIIDVGHGGAVLSRRRSVHDAVVALDGKLDACRPESKDAVSKFSRRHTDLYNQYYPDRLHLVCDSFKADAMALRSNILFRFDRSYVSAIESGLDRLSVLLRDRARKVSYLEKRLAAARASDVTIFRPNDGSIYWRFNLFVDERDVLLRHLLHKRFRVSSWFPSVDMFLEDRSKTGVVTPVSDEIGARIINFWVNEDVDFDYLNQVVLELSMHAQTVRGATNGGREG